MRRTRSHLVDEAAWREHILTSMLKRLDMAVYDSLAEEAEGMFTPGEHILGLAEGGMELAYSGGYIEPYRERLEELRDMIIGGEIEVPCIPAIRAVQAAQMGVADCEAVP